MASVVIKYYTYSRQIEEERDYLELEKCVKCQKEIKDTDEICLNCGRTIIRTEADRKDQMIGRTFMGLGCLFWIVMSIFFFSSCSSSGTSYDDNDFNYDGKVDKKDSETFLKWKINQEENGGDGDDY